jgi:flagellar protein FlaI
MRLPRTWAFELMVLMLVNLLVGYLTVEALDAFKGAPVPLPLSTLLLRSLHLGEALTSGTLAIVLVLTIGIYVNWVRKFIPEISKTIGETPGAVVKTPPPDVKTSSTPKQEGFGPPAEDLRPFVDVFPVEGYPLNVYAAVTKDEGAEGHTYMLIEPTLTDVEKAQLEELKKLLVDELDVDLRSIRSKTEADSYLANKVKMLAKKYGSKISEASLAKLQYFISRDFIRLGKIDPLMHDNLIEDISCDGTKIPIYVWYRDYESIPTNIMFDTDEELDSFVSKLAYVAGKHVSLADPIVEASLEDGSRLHLTYGKEMTQRGSTFTIRKFRSDPLTIVDLVKSNTMNSDIAAYLWYLIEKKLALLVAGGTASGKTTSLNALSMFIQRGQKIVSVEDTPELSLPHDNWIQSVTRGAGTSSEITMFDLLKASLRQRPDVLIVGEVRGEEAFTLLQ